MRILEDHQHRLLACQSRELRRQRFQRSLPTFLRGHVERRITSIIREGEHLREQCGVLGRSRSLSNQGIELVQLCSRFIVVHQSGGAFHLADDRIKRAVRVLWRAEIAQAGVRFDCDAFQKGYGETRFSNACLTREQHDLTFTGLCPGPAPKQQVHFFLAANKGGQAGRVQRLEATLHGTWP